jgi:hypothetical protein
MDEFEQAHCIIAIMTSALRALAHKGRSVEQCAMRVPGFTKCGFEAEQMMGFFLCRTAAKHDEAAKRQFTLLHTGQRGCNEIDFIDHTLMVEADMTDRGEVKLPPANPGVI